MEPFKFIAVSRNPNDNIKNFYSFNIVLLQIIQASKRKYGNLRMCDEGTTRKSLCQVKNKLPLKLFKCK